MGSRAMGCVHWLTGHLRATCFAMPRRVRRESAFARSRPRTACEAHAGEVDVCVAPEPLRLVEGSSNASGRVVASSAVAAVAAGCSGAGSTASLQSDSFSRFLDYLAAQPGGGTFLPELLDVSSRTHICALSMHFYLFTMYYNVFATYWMCIQKT